MTPQEVRSKIKQYMKNTTMAVVTLNVGDGDAIILRFPKKQGEGVCCAVVDCYKADKTFKALKALNTETIPFICATHPHSDHTRGISKLIRLCRNDGITIKQFWDSGFRHVSKIQYDLIKLLRELNDIDLIYPTSGYETVINTVKIKILSPSIQLKNRYDTFGTNINNASIVLKLEYPPKDIAPYYQTKESVPDNVLAKEEQIKQYSVILAGDAQFDAWARITEEFPELKKTGNRGQMIDPDVIEHQPLRCQVLKAPHHMSKHGISLETLEILHPRHVIASCSNRSRHGFPHELTVLAVRDIRENPEKDDGIYYTGHRLSNKRSGTIVALFRKEVSRPNIFCLRESVTKSAPLPKFS